jgi:hypothetical protein
MRLPHWFGETVTTYDTTLGRLPSLLPVFERRPLGRNRFRDAIVRRAPGYHEPLTVGMVSKRYVLVQHDEAIGAVSTELKRAGIDPGAIPTQVQMSEYGTRMALRATLPEEFAFDAADGHRMALTFECLNSVDKTVPLFAAVGWFRFICSNGLIVGTTCARVRQRHSPSLRIDEFAAVLATGVESATQDREAFLAWRSTPITDDRLAWWVDGAVAEAWGPFAASRVYGIASPGYDGKPSMKNAPPHERTLTRRFVVPGNSAPRGDAYGIVQALAWVAARRPDVAERLQWRSEIQRLMNELVNPAASA